MGEAPASGAQDTNTKPWLKETNVMEQVKKLLPFKRGDKSAKRVADPRETVHPFARMDRDLQHLMDRFGFSSLFPASLFSDRADSWFGDFSPSLFKPTLDVADKQGQLEVTIELPGMSAEDVDIDVRDGALVIRGEKRSEETKEEDGYYRTERSFGSFERAIPLPTEVDAEATEATFEKGVLKVRLPKAKPEQAAKKIQIKSV